MSLVLPASPSSISTVVRILRSGGVVVFPTETVYGIGCDIRDHQAVLRIFAIKNRPRNQPLLAHCSDISELTALVTEVPIAARRLIHHFWPGPLTLVFRRKPTAAVAAAVGGDTIGIRMVAHDFTCEVIRRLGAAIAGTSANESGKPATYRFEHLDPMLAQQADALIDAGDCGSGVPSTVLDMTVDPPRIVREGAVPAAAVNKLLGSRVQT